MLDVALNRHDERGTDLTETPGKFPDAAGPDEVTERLEF
jgi:hypothetical protein